MTPEIKAELAQRRADAPGLPWDGVEDWVERAYLLIRPGGVLAISLPDGKPFTARKPHKPSASTQGEQR